MSIMKFKPHFFLLFLIGGFFLSRDTNARDPKVNEMPAIQEISYFLKLDAAEIYQGWKNERNKSSQIEKLGPSLETLFEKSHQFHNKIVRNSRAPWRTDSAYKELNQAFVNAQQAFIAQNLYLADPRPFEEIAFLMGALLQYYQEPIYQYYPTYAYPTPFYPGRVYPRVVYPWIPNYYTFSHCRFTNPRLYPWGKNVYLRKR
jgi:hypothetical protein